MLLWGLLVKFSFDLKGQSPSKNFGNGGISCISMNICCSCRKFTAFFYSSSMDDLKYVNLEVIWLNLSL